MLTRRRIPVQEPYDAPGIFRFLADRVIDGVEHADLDQLRYARTVHLPHGPGAIEVTYTQGALETTLELADAADAPAAVGRVQRCLMRTGIRGTSIRTWSRIPCLRRVCVRRRGFGFLGPRTMRKCWFVRWWGNRFLWRLRASICPGWLRRRARRMSRKLRG